MTDLIGKIFDRKYRLTRLIGEGGMGSVYEAEHTLIERKVAVKVMHPEFTTSTEVADRFFREAQASSAIGHPNIIEIFDVGLAEDGTAFIVMELLEGESLSDRMAREGKIPPNTAVSVILQVLSALSMAHQKGIIHRDLKPDNVFLSIDNRGRHEVKLLDFGIAKVQGEMEGDQGLTKTGTVLGTPNYMSPEQARGKDIDGRIDIWSAGVMLYEMLCGTLPFQGDSYNAVLSDILLELPRPLKALAPDIPDGLVRVVEMAMQKDRDLRYPDVQTMISDILAFHEQSELLMSDSAQAALKNSIAPPPSTPPYKKDPALGNTAAVAPDPAIMQAMSPELGGGGKVGNVTLRELEFGKGRVGDDQKPRRPVIWIPAIVAALAAVAFLGLTMRVKKEDQSVAQAGMEVLKGVMSLLKGGEWSPFKRSSGIPPKVAKPEMAPVPAPPDANLEDAGYFEAELPDEVTIQILGLSPKAKIAVNGRPVLSRFVIPKSNRPVNLRINDHGKKPIVKKIVPSENMVIDTKAPPKHPKGKKKKRKKRVNKNR